MRCDSSSAYRGGEMTGEDGDEGGRGTLIAINNYCLITHREDIYILYILIIYIYIHGFYDTGVE
jgi:hypothetical protein